MSIYRHDTRDGSFLKFVNVQQTIPSLTEYQIALSFARDYRKNDRNTNGMFIPYWDTENITAEAIVAFKKKNHLKKVDVFISIGGRDASLPFKTTDKDSWISSATESIKSIIDKYFQPLKEKFGIGIGLDVYYEHIDDKKDFPFCIGELIKNLKKPNLISLASISPSFKVLNDYRRLYQEYGDYIDFVVYQFYDEVDPIPDPLSFVARYEAIAKHFLPKNNILLGYSSVRDDWANLAPIVFLNGGILILLFGQCPGVSIWDTGSASTDWALLAFGLMFDPKRRTSA